MDKIVLIGASGMMGSDFPDDVIRSGADITDIQAIDKMIHKHNPKVVINCAGITDVSLCERFPEIAYLVHVAGSVNLAARCYFFGIKLIQVSTRYSGSSCIYGQTKKIAEDAVFNISTQNGIVRLPWLFGKKNDKRFVSTVRKCLEKNEPIPVYEETGSPTYTKDVAEFIVQEWKNIYGVMDVCNSGVVTREEWAKEIVKALGHKKAEFTLMKREIEMKETSSNMVHLLRPWKEALWFALT